ncbi:MAG: hypothetical protein V4436_02560 [Patescibacteria group bacterium]
MDAQIYEFPTGKKQPAPMRAWVAPVSAYVWFVGIKQTLIPEREGVVSQQPYFLVQVFNGAVGDKTASFTIEVESVKGLHATLYLLVDAAHTRDQGFTVTDYSNGETEMGEEYRASPQE